MNKTEILYALEYDQKVHWINEGYEVYCNGDHLYTRFIYNDSCCRLQENEYKECFIGDSNEV